MWTKDQAIELITKVWNGVSIYGYHIALTGSVLYKGASDNDLDIVLYPSDTPHDDYRQCLDYLKKEWNITEHFAVNWDNSQHKLVFDCTTIEGRKINIFIPNFTLAGKLDSTEIKSVKDFKKSS